MHRRESGKQISAWENIKMLIHTNSALGDMIVSKFQNIMNMKFRRHWQVEVYQRKENKKNFMRKNYMRPTLRKLHHYNTLRHPLEEVNKIDNVSEKDWSNVLVKEVCFGDVKNIYIYIYIYTNI